MSYKDKSGTHEVQGTKAEQSVVKGSNYLGQLEIEASRKSHYASKEEAYGLPASVEDHRMGAIALYKQIQEISFNSNNPRQLLESGKSIKDEWEMLASYRMKVAEQTAEMDLKLNGRPTAAGCENVATQYTKAATAFAMFSNRKKTNECLRLAKKFDDLAGSTHAAHSSDIKPRT
ncbi:MAG: hypothetical protein KGH58_03335 [Candidatus Micrarchaeota archaeon]|nr:hypothetical protein [Candidatus Micrarchaeota archaeon]